jgi:hypothetical protein
VRTCEILKASITIFITSKGASFFFDGWKEKVLAIAADIVLTGGMATVLETCYSLYNKARAAVDVGYLQSLPSKREQAKYLASQGFGVAGDNADMVGTQVAEQNGWW